MYKSTASVLCILYCVGLAVAGFNFGSVINHVNKDLSGYVLPKLNAVRRNVEPAPEVPLADLVWDPTLARGAGQWASKCVTDDYSDDYYAMKVGESITTVPLASVLDVNKGLLSWARQNATYNLDDDACLDGFDCKAYKQLVWSRTRSVGCSTNLCKGNAVLVCQFFPAGNFPGVRPFHSDDDSQAITELISEDNATIAPQASNAYGRAEIGGHSKRGQYGDYTCTVRKSSTSTLYGYCQTKTSCFNSGKSVVAYWGGKLCTGYDTSTTVCCTFNDDQPSTSSSSAAATTSGSNTATGATTGNSATTGSASAATTATSSKSTTTSGNTALSPTLTDTSTATNSPSPTSAPSGSRLQFPTSLDWRDVNAVSLVKNQGSCGSCWDFSATGAAESAYAIFTGGSQIDLSEQQILDCTDHSDGYNTCNGGYPGSAVDYYVKKGGVVESTDPYQGKVTTCDSFASSYTFSASGYVSPFKTKDDVLAALKKYGPVVVMVDADDSWQSYRGGVLSKTTSTAINHAVLLVGYDSANDAWIIKNSWSTGWGEKGYIRIARTGDYLMTKNSPSYITKTA